MKMIKEFKEFALRGNLIDMAIAFVMGSAFGKVITGFIDGMVMPIVGAITAGTDFKLLKWVISEAKFDASGKEISAESAIQYGAFITILIDFVLVAFFMFLLIKGMNNMKRKQIETPNPAPAPTEEQLLTEIRDLLKKSTES
jgi:large conductance mechanosensitive channel